MIGLNDDNEEMISIPKWEYKKLVEISTRCKVVSELCEKDKYIGLETLLNIFEGNANEDKA